LRNIYSIIIIFPGFPRFLGTGYELASLRFDFLSLGDALASADEKKSKIYSKESILFLCCFRPDSIYKEWLNGIGKTKLNKITTPLWVFGGLWLISDLTFFERFDPQTQFYLSMVGGLIVLTIISLEIHAYLKKKGIA